jgi:tRNA-2-methylthio-N6-dimethylallyladenosine synthase
MQSGSSDVLKNMRRRYTREEYLAIANKIRNEIPDVTITSDFIAGFPGETDEQFEETLSIFDEAGIDYANTAAYSPRKQTPAATWKDRYISEKVKKERLYILNNKVKEATKKSNEKYIGKTLEVMVENIRNEDGKTMLNGRTRNNKIVHFEGDGGLYGKLVDVRIEDALIWCLKGII